MKFLTTFCSAVFLMTMLATFCNAQAFIDSNGQYHNHGPHLKPSYYPTPTYPAPMPGYYGGGTYYPPQYLAPRHPQYVTPSTVQGYTPWGGINTGNMQVDNTYFTPGRDMSRFNGSQRYVNRPVYDGYGRIVGYERGTEWVNSHTGQVHGDKSVITNNGMGGTNETKVLHSTAGGDIKPMNTGK